MTNIHLYFRQHCKNMVHWYQSMFIAIHWSPGVSQLNEIPSKPGTGFNWFRRSDSTYLGSTCQSIVSECCCKIYCMIQFNQLRNEKTLIFGNISTLDQTK